jgi:phosphoenolpyruvate carboxylase
LARSLISTSAAGRRHVRSRDGDLRATPGCSTGRSAALMLVGPVWIWFHGERLDQESSRPRHATVASNGLRMALFSDAPLEYGHVSNIDMVLAKSDIGTAARYKELVEDAELREAIFSRLRGEYESSKQALLTIRGRQTLLEGNPASARTICDRFPFIDSAQPRAARAFEADPGRRRRRTRRPGHLLHHQRHRGRLAKQRIGKR